MVQKVNSFLFQQGGLKAGKAGSIDQSSLIALAALGNYIFTWSLKKRANVQFCSPSQYQYSGLCANFCFLLSRQGQL